MTPLLLHLVFFCTNRGFGSPITTERSRHWVGGSRFDSLFLPGWNVIIVVAMIVFVCVVVLSMMFMFVVMFIVFVMLVLVVVSLLLVIAFVFMSVFMMILTETIAERGKSNNSVSVCRNVFPNYHDFRVEFVNDKTYMALVSALRMVIMSMFVFHMAVFPVSTVLKDKCYSISFCIDTYQRRVITKPKVLLEFTHCLS